MIQDDRLLHTWLVEGSDHGPIEGLTRTLEIVHRTHQRPAWSFPGRWVPWLAPMATTRAAAYSLMAVTVLAALVLALAVALIVGSQRRLPPPVGPAGNGVIAYDTGPGHIIFITDRDGRHPRPLVGDVGFQRSPTFSPDGTKIAFWRRLDKVTSAPTQIEETDQYAQLWVANADGSGVRDVSAGVTIDPNILYSPNWSPDGRHLAFSSPNDDGLQQLYVASADGSEPVRMITGPDADRWAPTWSPDGNWIAFGKMIPGSPKIATTGVIRPDGTGERTFHEQEFTDEDGAFAESLGWLQDSSGFTYARGNDESRPDEHQFWAYLDAVDLASGDSTTIYREQSGWLHAPAWSPDGNWMAFISGERDTALRIASADGTHYDVLERCPGLGDNSILWAPDGRSLVAFCDGVPERISIDRTAPTEVLDLPFGASAVDWQRVAD
jgi:Tol biopolymer transport system component